MIKKLSFKFYFIGFKIPERIKIYLKDVIFFTSKPCEKINLRNMIFLDRENTQTNHESHLIGNIFDQAISYLKVCFGYVEKRVSFN